MLQGTIEINGDLVCLVTPDGQKRLLVDGAPIEVALDARALPTASTGIPGAPRNSNLGSRNTPPPAPMMGGMGGMGGGMGGMAGAGMMGGMMGGGAGMQGLMDRIMGGSGGGGALPPAGAPAEIPGSGPVPGGPAATGKAVIGQVAFPKSGMGKGAPAATGGGAAGGGGAIIPQSVESRLPPPMARFVPPPPPPEPAPGAGPLVITVNFEDTPKSESTSPKVPDTTITVAAPKAAPPVVPVPVPAPVVTPAIKEWVTGYFVANKKALNMTSRPAYNIKNPHVPLASGLEIRLLDERPETRVFTNYGHLRGSLSVPRATARCLWPVNILILTEAPAKWRRCYLFWYTSAKIVMATLEEDGSWSERDLPSMHLLIDVAEAKVCEKVDVLGGNTHSGPLGGNVSSGSILGPSAPLNGGTVSPSTPGATAPVHPGLGALEAAFEARMKQLEERLAQVAALTPAPAPVPPDPAEVLDAAWDRIIEFFTDRATTTEPDAEAAAHALEAMLAWQVAGDETPEILDVKESGTDEVIAPASPSP